jgi:integral membrane sensor domain MASE1
MVANCLATNNPTALKPSGDRMVATMWTTKVMIDSNFGNKFVKSLKRFNDDLASLKEVIKFAVLVAEGNDDLST